jgi:hypothetical protein
MPTLLSVSLMRRDGWIGRSLGALLPALLVLLVGRPSSARAQTGPTSPELAPAPSDPVSARPILLVRTAGDSEVMDRLRMELRAYGWRVVEAPADEALYVGSLAETVSERNVTAAVRVDVEKGQIEVHISRSWGNVQETLRSEGDKVDSQVLALRATEALRAHGLDLGPTIDHVRDAASRPATTPPPKSESPVPATPRADVEPTASNALAAVPGHEPTDSIAASPGIWLELAPSILASTGGFGLGVGGLVGLRLELSSRWSLSAMGTIPFGSHAVDEREGRATAAVAVVGGAAELTWLRRRLGSAALGLGATAVVMSMHGTGNSGYQGARETVLTQAPQGYLRFAGSQHRDWHFFGVLIVGVAIPAVSLRFAEREVRTWGAPFLVLGCGGEFRALGW